MLSATIRRSWRRLGAGLALAALGGVLAGCGAGATLDPVASAATKSENAGLARMTLTIGFTSPRLPGKTFAMSGTGLVGTGEAEMTVDMSQLLRQAGAPAGTDPTMKEIFLSEGGDYVIYLRAGLFGKLPGGAHWMKLDMTKFGQKEGVDVNKLMGSGSTADPSQLLGMLKAASGKVDDLGAETIDGTETTHYRATVDVAKAMEVQGVSADAVKSLEAQGAPASIPEDVWIGSDGLVRQLRMAYTTTSNGVPMHATMTMGLTGYGTTAAISAPAPGDAYDATNLALQGLQQTTTGSATTTTAP